MGHRVVVVGGGYGGTAVARRLDDVAEVVLVEPRDTFVHTVGGLRAVVDPAWEPRVFHRYEHMLRRGRVVHDWARTVGPGRVRLSSTEEISADVVVLATGTGYPFPAKYLETSQAVVSAHLARMREQLARCERVLVVGAGPVGLELTGELTSGFPGLGVTVVDQASDILTMGDYLPELRVSIREQLAERGVSFVTGAPLATVPPFDVGQYGPFVVETTAGVGIEAQMWFRCHGARPLTDYLDAELATQRHGDGTVRVTPNLTLEGQDRVFVVGDIADMHESKRATTAQAHAAVVAQNVQDVLAGREPSAVHLPELERIVLPLGPTGGASQIRRADGSRVLLGPEETARIKGEDLFSEVTAAVFAEV